MGVRPPADDSGEAELIEFGIAALDAKIGDADLSFPATRDEILDALGNQSIDYDAAGHSIDLATALERTDSTEYESKRDLLNELHPVFEDLRSSSTPGFVGWLRNLFS